LKGLTSDYQLTLPTMLRRAEALYGPKEIVTRRPDKSFHRYTYADFVRRAKKLAVTLGELGLRKSDRVATLAWNNHQHLEAYFGVPCAGLVLHTINPRLSVDDLAYIIPQPAATRWIDNMAIPNGAPHPDNAHKFINHILDAEVGAKLSNYTYFASPNKAALPMIDEALLDIPT